MRAAIQSAYGSPDVLTIQDIEIPVPKDDEVLIRVYATTVNRTDCGILWAKPFFIRFFTGLFKPRLRVSGTDFAGKIEAVGDSVKQFKVGDRVMGFGGMGLQSHAEYLTIPETKVITTIPDDVTYPQAAACLEGAIYALSAMIFKMNPQAGQKALVYGATGAIGSAAVQLLKYFGVTVTAVCHTKNLELVKSLGADRLIDYTSEDFTSDAERYSFVIDAVGKSSFGQCKPLLLPGGSYVSSDAGPRSENIYLPLFTAMLGGKKVISPMPRGVKRSVSLIRLLVEQGKFKPVIDREYPLEQIADAFRYVATGQKIGNVIITMPFTP